jgi:hypothetical protein
MLLTATSITGNLRCKKDRTSRELLAASEFSLISLRRMLL